MSITIEAQATRTLIQQDGVSRVAINDDGSMEILTPTSNPTGNMVPTVSQIPANAIGFSAEVVLSSTAFQNITIPSWAKFITLGVYRLSTNGTSPIEVRLGTSGGIVATGYVGGGSSSGGSSSSTTGLLISRTTAASDIIQGTATFQRIGSTNKWCMSSSIQVDDGTIRSSASSVELSSAITQLQVTTQGGVNLFDSGSISVSYL